MTYDDDLERAIDEAGYTLNSREARIFSEGARWGRRWANDNLPDERQPTLPLATERCAARQFSDQMTCARCGLTWDTNDEDAPACPVTGEKPR